MFQYRRTATASRRAARKIRFLHVSRTYTWMPDVLGLRSGTGKFIPSGMNGKGETLDLGRNAAKRARRLAMSAITA